MRKSWKRDNAGYFRIADKFIRNKLDGKILLRIVVSARSDLTSLVSTFGIPMMHFQYSLKKAGWATGTNEVVHNPDLLLPEPLPRGWRQIDELTGIEQNDAIHPPAIGNQ